MDKDFSAGFERVLALITDDLHERVDGDDLAAVVAWGTLFNAVHYARGLRALHDAGCCSAVAPVFRSLLEYAVGTMWLADAGEEAVEVLNRSLVYTQNRLNRSLEGVEELAAWREALPEEAVRNFESVISTQLGPHPDERLSSFTALLSEYGFAPWVPIYNSLSGISHLSTVGAQRFVRESPSGWDAQQVPFGPFEYGALCLEIALPVLVDAMAAFDKLLAGRPWRPELERIAEEYEMVITDAKRKTRPAKSGGVE